MDYDTIKIIEVWQCSRCEHTFPEYQTKCDWCTMYDMIRDTKMITEPREYIPNDNESLIEFKCNDIN